MSVDLSGSAANVVSDVSGAVQPVVNDADKVKAAVASGDIACILSLAPNMFGELSGVLTLIVADLSGVSVKPLELIDQLPKLVAAVSNLKLSVSDLQDKVLAAVHYLIARFVSAADQAEALVLVKTVFPAVVAALGKITTLQQDAAVVAGVAKEGVAAVEAKCGLCCQKKEVTVAVAAAAAVAPVAAKCCLPWCCSKKQKAPVVVPVEAAPQASVV